MEAPMNRLLILALSVGTVLISGCATGGHPELRPFTAQESRQLALEDLYRRGLPYDELQARKRQLMADPQPQHAHEFDNRGEASVQFSPLSKARQG